MKTHDSAKHVFSVYSVWFCISQWCWFSYTGDKNLEKVYILQVPYFLNLIKYSPN